MAQAGDPVAAAKNALAGAKKAFPSTMAPKPVATPAPKVAAPKSSISTGEPEKGIGNELKAKSDNVAEYMKAGPKMHKGGPVLADGIYSMKAGEHVLTASEAGQARKHALMASGMKSLAMAGKPKPTAKSAAPAAAEPQEKTSITVEGANVLDRTTNKVPPAPRSPLKQDDAYQKQRVSTT